MRDCPYCEAVSDYEAGLPQHIDVVFDGPPSRESGRFIEVEDDQGRSLTFGQWVQRSDGYWALRFNPRRPV